MLFEGRLVFVLEQVADFFEVTNRTIKTYIGKYEQELKQNGYEVLRGKCLSDFKIAINQPDAGEINFVNIKAPQLAIFDFRAFLNLAMLLVESERARLLRQAILDIVIDSHKYWYGNVFQMATR